MESQRLSEANHRSHQYDRGLLVLLLQLATLLFAAGVLVICLQQMSADKVIAASISRHNKRVMSVLDRSG